LGGTHFAGRAITEAALADGIDVTLLNRGNTPLPDADVRTLIADRTDPAALREALGDQEWDAVIDTWSWAPTVVATACALLRGKTGHFGYVSTLSVYADPIPHNADETAPTVDAAVEVTGSAETVTDTWAWLQAEGDPPRRSGRPGHGLPPEKEQALLANLQ
jgi:nucleoside-diphosphate-sugar epimerase